MKFFYKKFLQFFWGFLSEKWEYSAKMFLFILFFLIFSGNRWDKGTAGLWAQWGKDQCTIYLFICRIEWLWIEKEIEDVLFYFSQLWYIFLCRLKIGIATTCWVCILRHDWFWRRACCFYLFNYCCCSEFWRRECLFFVFFLIF